MKKDFVDRYGPWAVVAGGSEGLGAAFAEELAAAGLKILLVARRTGPLEESAAGLRSRHGVEVRTLSLDLSRPDFLSILSRETAALEVGLVVCDAAQAHTGPFLEGGLEEYLGILDTNCRAPLSLMRHFGGLMAERGRGGILVMSSLSAFWGSPYVAVYGATKAFLLNLSEALWHELGARGVSVTVCTAGPILTPNYLGTKPAGGRPSALEMRPAEVARQALAGLGRKSLVVPGFAGKLAQLVMGRLVPRRMAITVLAKSTGAMYDKRSSGSEGDRST